MYVYKMVLVFEMHVQLIDTGIDEFFFVGKGVKRGRKNACVDDDGSSY